LDSKELILTIDQDLADIPSQLSDFNVTLEGERNLVFRVPPAQVPVDAILTALSDIGLGVVDLVTKQSDLEDIFLMLTRENKDSGISNAR